MPIQSINSNQFESEVINVSYNIPVLLDCYRDTCPPCVTLLKLLESISTQKINFIIKKINVTVNPQVTEHFRIQTVPTLLLFWEGQMIKRSGYLGTKGEVIAFANPE